LKLIIFSIKALFKATHATGSRLIVRSIVSLCHTHEASSNAAMQSIHCMRTGTTFSFESQRSEAEKRREIFSMETESQTTGYHASTQSHNINVLLCAVITFMNHNMQCRDISALWAQIDTEIIPPPPV
jgi:hypothetical protein